MYRTVEFKSTIANDWKFNDNDNPVAPGARELADAIVANLRSRVNCVSSAELHSYYGWAFAATYEGATFYNVLNPIDKLCYLTISMNWYVLKSVCLMRPRGTFDRYCGILGDALAEIPEVSAIAWEA